MSVKRDDSNKDQRGQPEKMSQNERKARSEKQDHDGMQLVEARTAIIFLKNTRLITKNECTQWIMKSLFQPCTVKDSESMNVLYLSKSRKRVWLPDTTAKTRDRQLHLPEDNTENVFVLTPRTHILSVTQEYRLVYIVDLSSSLATVGVTPSQILLAEVFQSLRRSLEGIVRPFAIPTSSTEKVVIKPLLCVTVIADCSQFASNANVISMLVDQPTLRSFIQNVYINPDNIDRVVGKLYAEFMALLHDMTNFRKLLTKHTDTPYKLDVGAEVSLEGDDITDHTLFQAENNMDSSGQDSSTSQDFPSPGVGQTFFTKEDGNTRPASKEVWGIGKSGASLSRILHLGQFALKLLPQHGKANIILITDGAVRSSIGDNSFIRQLAEDDVACHVIQIGFHRSFIPGTNFGFIPDTDTLRYLTRVTGGTFLFSEQCQDVSEYPTIVPQEALSPLLKDLHITLDSPGPIGQSSAPRYPNIEKTSIHDNSVQLANMYHHRFLFREYSLGRHGDNTDDARHAHLRDKDPGESGRDTGKVLNFPWDPNAPAPQQQQYLIKYREYPLPSDFSHVIAARAREGYILQSITFESGTGNKREESDFHSMEPTDFHSVRKDRILITLALHWVHNVTIEYRIRATWLPVFVGDLSQLKNENILLSSNLFSRAKAPRAEILVRTDEEFAHLLQNWDAYRRRVQALGMMKGSHYLHEATKTPLYTKLERLHTILTDCFEGDETLKQSVCFNNNYLLAYTPSQSTTKSTSSEALSLHTSYLRAFKTFWNRINNSEFRYRSRCWYDHECIDLLVGDVSPYMSPKWSSHYNQDFQSNVDEPILHTIEAIRDVLGAWADFVSEDGIPVKIMYRYMTSATTSENAWDHFSNSLSYPLSFLELRVCREYGRLVALRLLFFNVDYLARKRTVKYITQLLQTSDATKPPYSYICHRPFNRLLMKDPKHYRESPLMYPPPEGHSEPFPTTPTRPTFNLQQPLAWYIPSAMFMMSEYIVRDYLKHMIWLWETDCTYDLYHRDNRMMPIGDLAFQFLCQARIDQGYHLVFSRPDSTHFYQEIPLSTSGDDTPLCAVQYYIWKDANNGKITTELWMEPNGDISFEQYEFVKAWTSEPDRQTISQLVTFDRVHEIGRSKGKGDFKFRPVKEDILDKDIHDKYDDQLIMILPQLFDIASLLRSSRFLVASFECPSYQWNQAVKDGSSAHLRHTRRRSRSSEVEKVNSDLEKDESYQISDRPARYVQDLCIRPDPTLDHCKENIAKLEPTMQSYAVLHYLVEQSLSEIMDGEIVMSDHYPDNPLWVELLRSLDTCQQQSRNSNIQFIQDLTQTRCFVKVLDPRSFAIVLFPTTGSVAKSLSTFHAKGTTSMSIDVLLFECFRLKPLNPTKKNVPIFCRPLDRTKDHQIHSLTTDDEIVTVRIRTLAHAGNGLGDIVQPDLYEGEFKNYHTRSELSERMLRISQDISRTYINSLFVSLYLDLFSEYTVQESALLKAVSVCDESAMEIDIREFVNAMSLQRKEDPSRFVHHVNVQEKFTSIFQHYFEPVSLDHDGQGNLYYYRPPICRHSRAMRQQDKDDMSLNEKIAHLIDLVAYSHTPLLVRLECVYQPSPDEKEVVIPISSLPVSYDGERSDGKTFMFQPTTPQSSNDGIESNQDHKMILRLTCLTLHKNEGDRAFYDTAVLPTSSQSSFVNWMRSQPTCFFSLRVDQQHALGETEARIRWLLAEEIAHFLLKTEFITESTLEYVIQQLGHSGPFVDFPTPFTIPVTFVNDPDSKAIFMKELEKDDERTPHKGYRLSRLGDYFYVSQDHVYHLDPTSTGAVSSTTTTEVPILANHALQEMEDDQYECDALGIRIHRDRTTQKDGWNDHQGSLLDRPLYWLILHPKDQGVQVFYYTQHHERVDRARILERTKSKILEIQERTNRLVLLKRLQETHLCSALLNAPESQSAKEDSSDEDDVSVDAANQDKFNPGQFECPKLSTKRFPLYWRLSPNTVLTYLKSDVLHLFTVRNRANMYVIERDDAIIYCKMYEENISSEKSSTNISSPSILEKNSNTNPEVNDMVSDSDKGKTTNGKKVSYTSTVRQSASKHQPSDTRYLVVDVYGIDMPPWVETEFFNLIENRLVSHITLSEIQQFLSRNSISKLTSADVDFIFPAWKPPAQRQVLRVPSLVKNANKFLAYMTQLIRADSLKSFSGECVRVALRKYYEHAFYSDTVSKHSDLQLYHESDDHPRQVLTDTQDGTCNMTCVNSDQVNPEVNTDRSTCFYYNCIKRVLGSSAPLELRVGQGVAGICITLVDDTGKPAAITPDDHFTAPYDPDMILKCLEEEFREATLESSAYYLWVDIWSVGSVDNSALADHLYQCFRRALCDYCIEMIINTDPFASLSDNRTLQRAVSAKSSKRLGATLRKKFIESIIHVLRKAAAWNSPTVSSLEQEISIDPWCMDDIVDIFDDELRRIDGDLRPTVAWTPMKNNVVDGHKTEQYPPDSLWHLYDGLQALKRSQKTNSMSIQLVATCGLEEIVEKLGGSGPGTTLSVRRVSHASDQSSQKGRSRHSSNASATPYTAKEDHPSLPESRSDRNTSRASSLSGATGRQKVITSTSDRGKHWFILLILNVRKLCIYTYNWSESSSLAMFETLSRVAVRQEARRQILDNILHQKMGLFHHCSSINAAMKNQLQSPSSSFLPSSAESRTNHITLPVSLSGNLPRVQTEVSITSAWLAGNELSIRDIKEVITGRALLGDSRDQLHSERTVTMDDEKSSSLALRPFHRSELENALSYWTTDSIADTASRSESDVLRRHGLPFLDNFVRISTLLAIHAKALSAYTKWQRRYGDSQVVADDQAKKLTCAEVSTILRSSRVLHFCRAPLYFCSSDTEWTFANRDPAQRELSMEWFKSMADTLKRDYATYLEGIDMQLVDFAIESGPENAVKSTTFDIGKGVSLKNVSCCLLRVFEGGSIICEVLLTNTSVSVTLYTLHRKYGRLDYSPHKRESMAKKRHNFKMFEKNCGYFKQAIHINSFVYDFHLRYIQQMLNTHTPLPPDLNLLRVLRKFTLHYAVPAAYSRNRLVHGFYYFDSTLKRDSFYDNLFRYALRRKIPLLHAGNMPIAAVVTLDSFDKSSTSCWEHTLIVSPIYDEERRKLYHAGEAENKIIIEYFILNVHKAVSMPEDMITHSWIRAHPTSDVPMQPSDNPSENIMYDIYVPGEQYTLGNIIENARSRMDQMVSEVMVICKGEIDWATLYRANVDDASSDNVPLLRLLDRFHHVSLSVVDMNLKRYVSLNVNWNRVLDMIHSMTNTTTKDMHIQDERHVIIYSNLYMDYLIHLRLDTHQKIHGWIVCREESHDKTNFDNVEKVLVETLGNLVGYYLWKVASNKIYA